jgi:hypothetical protein
MRPIFAAVLVLALLLAASCTGNEATPASSMYDASTTLSSGVKGDLSYVGGPLVVSPAARHLEPGDVIAFAEDGTRVGEVHFPEGQGFSLSLPPGEYRLVATSGDAQCPDRTRVLVSPNSFETVHIHCDVR